MTGSLQSKSFVDEDTVTGSEYNSANPINHQNDGSSISAEASLHVPLHGSLMFNKTELGGEKRDMSGLRHLEIWVKKISMTQGSGTRLKYYSCLLSSTFNVTALCSSP